MKSSQHGSGSFGAVIYIVVSAILLGGILWGSVALIERGKAVAIGDAARALEVSTEGFTSTGGAFPNGATANEALVLLQTPVDALSQKAGFGIFPVIDHKWVLEPVGDDFDGARLTFTRHPVTGVPIWGVATSGAGFIVEKDSAMPLPEPADWKARVDRAGHVNARTTGWVWDHAAPPPAGPTFPVVVTPPPSGGDFGPTTYATLRIDGPTTINSAGSYYWVGFSSLAGNIRISVAGRDSELPEASRVESIAQVFAPGESGQLTITLSLAGHGTIQQVVNYSIPLAPSIEITGPDVIEDLTPAQWTATTPDLSQPIRIQVDDGSPKEAEGRSVTSDGRSWPANTNRDITVSASAMNASGLAQGSKLVRLRIPPPPLVAWQLPDTLRESMVVTAPGTYTVRFYATNNCGPGTIAIASGSHGEGVESQPATVSNVTEINYTFTVSQPDPAKEVSGEVRLGGTMVTKVGQASAELSLPVYIRPQMAEFSWTVDVEGANGSQVRAFRLKIFRNGATHSQLTANGGSTSATFNVQLPTGTYSIVGEAGLSDGSTLEARVAGTGESMLTLEVVP